jgi:hypothetical protein
MTPLKNYHSFKRLEEKLVTAQVSFSQKLEFRIEIHYALQSLLRSINAFAGFHILNSAFYILNTWIVAKFVSVICL